MRKPVAAAAVAFSVLTGGGAGALMFAPTIVGAQTSGGSSTTTPSTPATPDWVTGALKPLVDAGTITQAQADAVSGALKDARPPHGPKGIGAKGLGNGLAAAASALGVTEQELHTALHSGQTIADVARSKNVDPQKVIDAVVAAQKTAIEQAVTDGKLTRAQADEILANVADRVTSMVNDAHPMRGPGGPGRRGR